jgi:hypothetical protein
MAHLTRGPAQDPYDEPPDAAAYARLRWIDLVDSLVGLGVPVERARAAVAAGVVAHERGWSRLVAEDDPDALVWAEACAVADVSDPPLYPPLLGHLRGGVGDPLDRPEPWLARARAHRRGAVRRQAVWSTAVAAVVLLAVGLAAAWWGSRPEQPPVREAVNQLPVAWYSDGELHLGRVVVVLADVTDFVADDDGGVVARVGDDRLVEIAADGTVRELAEAPAELDDPDEPVPPPDLPLGPDDRVAQSVRGPGSVTAFLIDSGARPGAGVDTRGSESGGAGGGGGVLPPGRGGGARPPGGRSSGSPGGRRLTVPGRADQGEDQADDEADPGSDDHHAQQRAPEVGLLLLGGAVDPDGLDVVLGDHLSLCEVLFGRDFLSRQRRRAGRDHVLLAELGRPRDRVAVDLPVGLDDLTGEGKRDVHGELLERLLRHRVREVLFGHVEFLGRQREAALDDELVAVARDRHAVLGEFLDRGALVDEALAAEAALGVGLDVGGVLGERVGVGLLEQFLG